MYLPPGDLVSSLDRAALGFLLAPWLLLFTGSGIPLVSFSDLLTWAYLAGRCLVLLLVLLGKTLDLPG